VINQKNQAYKRMQQKNHTRELVGVGWKNIVKREGKKIKSA
jgi:hypothetical protein